MQDNIDPFLYIFKFENEPVLLPLLLIWQQRAAFLEQKHFVFRDFIHPSAAVVVVTVTSDFLFLSELSPSSNRVQTQKRHGDLGTHPGALKLN